MEKDRRARDRQKIRSLVYVEIGEGNGGIVLNVGETGISVQAAGVLDEGEAIQMRVQIPRTRRKIELRGEIEWLSASRKEAGLRFIDLPEDALEQIRKWMAREASPGDFEDEPEEIPEAQNEKRAEPRGETRRVPLAAAPAVAEAPDATGVGDAENESYEEAESEGETVDAFAALSITDRDGVGDGEDLEQAEAAAAVAEEDESAETLDAEDEDFVYQEAATVAEEDEKAPVREAERKSEGKSEIELEEGSEKEKTGAEPESEHETEDDLIRAFGPPVVPYERRPSQAPFSAMSAMATPAGTSENSAVATAVPAEPQIPFAAEAAKTEPVSTSGWKNFRVQLQTGWFLAALILLLALISFVAGMAVRRGALNSALGEQEDALRPKSAPVAGPTNAGGGSNTAAQTSAPGSPSAAPPKPLSIEIVDLADHHWSIPATTGSSRAGTATAGSDAPVSGSVSANPVTAEPKPPTPSAVNTGAVSPSAGRSAEAKAAPLVLSLPETPISATGSVAISAQRSVVVPAEEAQSAQSGRNLQVGQLINLVEPTYPAEAFQKRIEGTVKLHAVIGPDGGIETLTAVSGPKALAEASMEAVRNWRYSPTRMNGQALETQEEISFVFRLPN